jgi:hypothetical protein
MIEIQIQVMNPMMMLAALGLADVERDLIRTRTAEGRSRATAQGKAMGRPPSLNTGTDERGHQTARTGRYIEGIGRELRPQHHHHAPCHARSNVSRRLGYGEKFCDDGGVRHS